MNQQPGSDSSASAAGGPAERFYRALGRALDEHPDELAVVKKHIQQQVEGRPRLRRPDPNDRQTLVEGAERFHEVLVSLLESDRCRTALKVLDDAHHAKLADVGSGSGPRPKVLPAIFFGIGLGVGFCILDGLYGDPGGICF